MPYVRLQLLSKFTPQTKHGKSVKIIVRGQETDVVCSDEGCLANFY